jgi:hypothetical protein
VPSRLLSSIFFLAILATGVSSAQEGTAEVPIPENMYAGIIAYGASTSPITVRAPLRLNDLLSVGPWLLIYRPLVFEPWPMHRQR